MRTLLPTTRIAFFHCMLAITLVTVIALEVAHEHSAQVSDACYACQLSSDQGALSAGVESIVDRVAVHGDDEFPPQARASDRARHEAPRGPPLIS